MTELEAIEAIYQRWVDTWPGLQPLVPYSFANEAAATQGAFVLVMVEHADSEQGTQGRAPFRRFDRRGHIVVTLYAPVNAGRRQLAEMAGSVRDVFEGLSIGDVETYATSTSELAETGSHARAELRTPFWYTETR